MFFLSKDEPSYKEEDEHSEISSVTGSEYRIPSDINLKNWDENAKKENFDILRAETDHVLDKIEQEKEQRSEEPPPVAEPPKTEDSCENFRKNLVMRQQKLIALYNEIKILREITNELERFSYEDLKTVPFVDLSLENVLKTAVRENEVRQVYKNEINAYRHTLFVTFLFGGYFLWNIWSSVKIIVE